MRRVRWGNVGRLAALLAAGLLIATGGRGCRVPEGPELGPSGPAAPMPDAAGPDRLEPTPKRKRARNGKARRPVRKRGPTRAAERGKADGPEEAHGPEEVTGWAEQPIVEPKPKPQPQPRPQPEPPSVPAPLQPPPPAPRSGEFTPDPAP
ncbi:MAG: hypothetical protein ACRDLY_06405 [Thermoleophilaceae bacterium]